MICKVMPKSASRDAVSQSKKKIYFSPACGHSLHRRSHDTTGRGDWTTRFTVVSKYSGKVRNKMEQGFRHTTSEVDQFSQSNQRLQSNSVFWELMLEMANLVYFKILDLQMTYGIHLWTSGSLLCVFRWHTFVSISWMRKKQTAASQQSLVRNFVDWRRFTYVWFMSSKSCECVLLEAPSSRLAKGNCERHKRERVNPCHSHSDNSHSTLLYIFEDNAAVIQKNNKGRRANMRHVTKKAQRRVGLVVWASECESFCFDQVRAHKRSVSGYFSMTIVFAFVANQTTLSIMWCPQLISQTILFDSFRSAQDDGSDDDKSRMYW